MPQNLDEAVHKADVLLEALSWIRQFRGRHVVIKLGGSAMEETEAVKSFLTDVIFMSTVGMRRRFTGEGIIFSCGSQCQRVVSAHS